MTTAFPRRTFVGLLCAVIFGLSAGSSPALEPTPPETVQVVGLPKVPSTFRVWTQAADQPKSAEARFVKYDAISGLVHFVRRDGRAATASLAKLCEADRRFIGEALGDEPLKFSGPGIAPPPMSPPVAHAVGRALNAVGLTTTPEHQAAIQVSLPLRFVGAASVVNAPKTAATPGRLVTLSAVKQPADSLESLPTPAQDQGEAAVPKHVWPRVAFYGCRGTWHLIDGMGTASYRFHGQWWLTALERWNSPGGWWYYRENPALNATGRYWAFRLWKTPCGYLCHDCGSCGGCGHHHHHYGFEVWLWHNHRWHLFDCAHVVRMLPHVYGDGLENP
jgi:hypothetical protein